jgi:methyl-accepting chemotaxis protein
MLANVKIGTKLGIGFGGITLLMIGMIGFGVQQLALVDARMEEIVDRRVPNAEHAAEIQINTAKGRIAVRDAILADAPDEVDRQVGVMAALAKNNIAALEKLDKGLFTEDGKKLLADMRAARGDYVAAYQKAFELAREGKDKDARALLAGDMRRASDTFGATIDALEQHNIAALAASAERRRRRSTPTPARGSSRWARWPRCSRSSPPCSSPATSPSHCARRPRPPSGWPTAT